MTAALAFCTGIAVPAGAALPPERLALLPPAATERVDFARDIAPILEASCVQCHGHGKSKGGFSLETRADFLEGGDSGAAAVAGGSAQSYVVELISGLNPEQVMPQKGKKLTSAQVALFRAWIDQGLPWPETITFAKAEPANLRPREVPAPPGGSGFANPLDPVVDAYFARHRIAWRTPVDDRTYARRVWLDAIGLLPPTAELEAFVADTAPDKRERLVQRLLADRQGYAEHWLTFWCDLLRNDYRGTGYTDGGRKQITNWIYSALARNLPYDQFVAELVNPGAEAEGFTKGILWRGAVNASMAPPMQAAQGVAQVFLGVNLKCASCHDSFINDYTLEDSYGLASIYADGPLEVAQCDRPTGQMAKVKFLYAELGSIDGSAEPAARRRQLASVITGRPNGRLPRTIVNRLWQRFLGHGLVEPVDEMDKPAWSPELIDWLAEDLVAHRYDLKHTIARILTSRAYQLPSVPLGEVTENYVFRGPAVRRLTAEQFVDALTNVAGIDRPKLDGKLNRLAALNPTESALPLQPRWIWGAAGAERKAAPATFVFRRVVTLPAAPAEAHFAICADDNYSLRINGKAAGASARRNGTQTDWLDARSLLKAGTNTIEVTAANLPPDDGRLASFATDARPEADSPAGLILYAKVRLPDATVMDFVSDAGWTVSADGREQGTAFELGGVELEPWKLGRHFLDLAAAPKDALPVRRASLVVADPLTTALGRPNREQVMTVRQGTATTLQALELTNGETLARLLRQAGEKVLAASHASTGALIGALYHQTLGRPPTSAELALAGQLVGSPAQAGGVEDLLWAITMLPEFQLIH